MEIAGSGIYFRTGCLVAQARVSSLDYWRVGFTASKKVGKAVVRNRCKRRMRVAADVVLSELGQKGVDYVFIARRSVFKTEWLVILESFKQAVTYLNRKILACEKL